MCLSIVRKTIPETSAIVWKLFSLTGRYIFDFSGLDYPVVLKNSTTRLNYCYNKLSRGGIPTGLWINSSRGSITTNFHRTFVDGAGIHLRERVGYPRGFHGFKSKGGATTLLYQGLPNSVILLPVEFEDIHTTGIDKGLVTYVARRMRIPNNWRDIAIWR